MPDPGAVELNVGRPRVVIADDHPGIRTAIEHVLSSSFDVIASVGDGRQALEAVHQLDPDVVVLDITMPELDGFDVARRLAARSDKRPKIVFLSGHHGDEYVEAAVEAGVQAFVVKSKMVTDLQAAIRHVLDRRLRVPAPSSLIGIADPRARHAMHVGSSDDVRLDELKHFAERALRQGDRVVAVCRPALLSAIASRLTDIGCDLTALVEGGRYQPFDAEQCLSDVMRGDEPDEATIVDIVRSLENVAATAANAAPARVVVLGELSPLLLRKGNIDGALAIERIWHRHASFHTLCSYCRADIEAVDRPDSFDRLHALHEAISS